MRARGCLIALGIGVGLLLLCCSLTWFIGIPRFRDSLADNLSESLSTEVAQQLGDATGTLDPGTYTLSVGDLQEQLTASGTTTGTSDFEISVDPNEMSIGFTSGSQTFGYTGTPVAKDGQLVMENMEVNNSTLGWVMPANRLGETIEDGINGFFEAQGLRIDSLELGDDEITFTVSDQ